MEPRTEFGAERTHCACDECKKNCRYMPGFMIPADLERMIPANVIDPFKWAEKNLLASPGALVMKDGELLRIPTLVPATKPDGSCINLKEDGRCGIHGVSPFGCAFFDCKSEDEAANRLSAKGLVQIAKAHHEKDLYHRIWNYLWRRWKRQTSADKLRERMAAA